MIIKIIIFFKNSSFIEIVNLVLTIKNFVTYKIIIYLNIFDLILKKYEIFLFNILILNFNKII